MLDPIFHVLAICDELVEGIAFLPELCAFHNEPAGTMTHGDRIDKFQLKFRFGKLLLRIIFTGMPMSP